MRSFNPIFNSINMYRSVPPFATAGSSIASNAFRNGIAPRGIGSKISLSGILNGAQKTIGTVNQIVPLYNQVKPMIENSKSVFKVFKGIKSKNTPSKNKNIRNNHVIHTKTSKDDTKIVHETNGNIPAKPFFV